MAQSRSSRWRCTRWLPTPDNLPMVEIAAAAQLSSKVGGSATATALASIHAAVVATFNV